MIILIKLLLDQSKIKIFLYHLYRTTRFCMLIRKLSYVLQKKMNLMKDMIY